jgi:hypothetical protein
MQESPGDGNANPRPLVGLERGLHQQCLSQNFHQPPYTQRRTPFTVALDNVDSRAEDHVRDETRYRPLAKEQRVVVRQV